MQQASDRRALRLLDRDSPAARRGSEGCLAETALCWPVAAEAQWRLQLKAKLGIVVRMRVSGSVCCLLLMIMIMIMVMVVAVASLRMRVEVQLPALLMRMLVLVLVPVAVLLVLHAHSALLHVCALSAPRPDCYAAADRCPALPCRAREHDRPAPTPWSLVVFVAWSLSSLLGRALPVWACRFVDTALRPSVLLDRCWAAGVCPFLASSLVRPPLPRLAAPRLA